MGFRFNPSAVKRTSLSVNLKAYYWFSNGDILISRSNTPELVAHAAVYSGEPSPCIYPGLLMRMRAEPSKADPQFIIYWLQSEETRSYIRAHAMGASSTMKKITQGDVCALPFPRIGVDDQRRIVAYLDSVQKQAVALKRAQEDMSVGVKIIARNHRSGAAFNRRRQALRIRTPVLRCGHTIGGCASGRVSLPTG